MTATAKLLPFDEFQNKKPNMDTVKGLMEKMFGGVMKTDVRTYPDKVNVWTVYGSRDEKDDQLFLEVTLRRRNHVIITAGVVARRNGSQQRVFWCWKTNSLDGVTINSLRQSGFATESSCKGVRLKPINNSQLSRMIESITRCQADEAGKTARRCRVWRQALANL